MNAIIAVAFGYLAGSVPFSFLLSRQRGVDLRRAGSGSIGASNVLRTTGAGAAVAAVLLDGVKGTMAVVVAQMLSVDLAATVAAACAAVIGHVYPVWLRFHGGKGVATAAGAFAVLAPPALAVATLVFVVVVSVTRFISAGSIAGAVTLAVVAAVNAPRVVAIGAAAAALVVLYRHRANMTRLVAGTEPRTASSRPTSGTSL
jgi:glycerol-3-phosphate acyltransferase PlsY